MALCAVGLAAAIAGRQSASADDTQKTSTADSRSTHVSLAGLDLSTTDGMRAARIRVHQAARKLCSQLEDPNDLSRHENYIACIDGSVTAALQQIKPASLATVAKETGHVPE